MAMKPFRKFYIQNNEDLNRVQDTVQATFNSLEADAFLSRIPITANIAAAPTTIVHNLGRTPIGWVIIDKNVTCDVWRISMTRENIILEASAPVTIKFYLF